MEKIIEFITITLHSQLFLLTITVVFYILAQKIYKRFGSLVWLNPLLIAVLMIIIVLQVGDVEFEYYYAANSMINFLLGLSVVALGYLLHTNIAHIREYKLSILASTLVGSIVGVSSVIGMAWLFGYNDMVSASLQPKSVTMPIALSLSQNSMGVPALTSIAVIFAGIFGSLVGPTILRIFRINDSVAKGLALGAASHAVGTARAMELGAIEGAVGGAAIGLMGIMTAIVLPLLNYLLC